MNDPKTYRGIMVSSTFTDLEEHRRSAIDVIHSLSFRANVMEFDGARADKDVMDSSLELVRHASAYIGVIGHKYGQTPLDETRNPDRLSITELEFNEASKLGRPILLFLMADDHPVTKDDVERDPEKIEKLEAFKKRAKLVKSDSEAERIYASFSSKKNFSEAVAIAIARLTDLIEETTEQPESDPAELPQSAELSRPNPPELRALPRYKGSHKFVGRDSELLVLDEWASGDDPNPFLLFEAIGGSGKSMLTWHWVNKRAWRTRDDWAGRFWYSFYESGATMTEFCREALSYMTGRPRSDYAKMRAR